MDEPKRGDAGGRRTHVSASSLGAQLRGMVLVMQPVSSLLIAASEAGLVVVAAYSARNPLPPDPLVRLMLAVACTQFATGALNDYRDRARDAVAKPEKPLVRGLIRPWHALFVAAAATALVPFLAWPLGALPLALLVAGEALGVAYDLGLKSTFFSGVLIAIGFVLLPLLAWGVFGRWRSLPLAVVPLGAALGVIVNIVNALPDLEADRALGVRGLPHRLGLRRCLAFAWAGPPMIAALLCALAVANLIPANPGWLAIATSAAVGSSLVALALYHRAPAPRTLRVTSYLQSVGVGILAVGWLAAVAR